MPHQSARSRPVGIGLGPVASVVYASRFCRDSNVSGPGYEERGVQLCHVSGTRRSQPAKLLLDLLLKSKCRWKWE